jgi:hypothetical protein
LLALGLAGVSVAAPVEFRGSGTVEWTENADFATDIEVGDGFELSFSYDTDAAALPGGDPLNAFYAAHGFSVEFGDLSVVGLNPVLEVTTDPMDPGLYMRATIGSGIFSGAILGFRLGGPTGVIDSLLPPSQIDLDDFIVTFLAIRGIDSFFFPGVGLPTVNVGGGIETLTRVSEPSTLALLALVLPGLIAVARRIGAARCALRPS